MAGHQKGENGHVTVVNAPSHFGMQLVLIGSAQL